MRGRGGEEGRGRERREGRGKRREGRVESGEC